MAFNIDKFRSSFVTGEPASPANYEVNIYRNPKILQITESNPTPSKIDLTLEDFIQYRCISCSLPGKMLNTVDRSTYGPNRKIATSTFYQDVVFSFIIADDAEELEYFHNWISIISNNVEINNASVNDVAYYNTYIADTYITQYNKSGNISRKIKLEESYPINVDAVPMGWEMSNDIMKVDVTLAYRNWRSVPFNN
jgi:hypothetical protein